MLPAAELLRGLDGLREGLIAQARLAALSLLSEPRMEDQRDRASGCVLRIEQAAQVEEFALRYYGRRPAPVAWRERERPDLRGLVPDKGAADAALVGAALRDSEDQLAAFALDLAARWTAPLCGPAAMLLQHVVITLPTAPGAARRRQAAAARKRPSGPVRALRGPRHVRLDPLYSPAFSLLERPDLTASRGDFDQAPFWWLAALRESMAAELCALSLVEYDGLPLGYYRDFAKQAWDEMRHALFFREVGISLLPDFLRGAPRGHPLLPGARRFAREGRGLPAPLEGNLYEVAWNATLPQRLVLMHHDTETPGIARFKRELQKPFWRARPQLAHGLRLSTYDEASHARLGRTWLHHLLPDRAARRAAIAQTRLLRGAFVISAFSHYHRRPLGELMRAASGAAP